MSQVIVELDELNAKQKELLDIRAGIAQAHYDFLLSMKDLAWDVKSQYNISKKVDSISDKLTSCEDLLYDYAMFVGDACTRYKQLNNYNNEEESKSNNVPKPEVPPLNYPNTPSNNPLPSVTEEHLEELKRINNEKIAEKEKNPDSNGQKTKKPKEVVNNVDVPETTEQYCERVQKEIDDYYKELEEKIKISAQNKTEEHPTNQLARDLAASVQWPADSKIPEKRQEEINNAIAIAIAKKMDGTILDYSTSLIGLTKDSINQINSMISDIPPIQENGYTITFESSLVGPGVCAIVAVVQFNGGKKYRVTVSDFDKNTLDEYRKSLKKLGQDEIKEACYELALACASGFVTTKNDINSAKKEAVNLISALTDESAFKDLVNLADGNLKDYLEKEGRKGLEKLVKMLPDGDQIVKAANEMQNLENLKNQYNEATGNPKKQDSIKSKIEKAENNVKTAILSN